MSRRQESPPALAALIAAGIVRAGDEWFMKRRGSRVVGHVTHDGKLEVEGVRYKSPSGAALGVTGHPTNGWKRWRYSTQDGRSEYVDGLRSRLR